ncbi:exo-beta-N-acetylmuramidase NamZ family protein [Chryseosolibacter indicus]|uniref:DUF1343 domain-containing protein n=1 Tax=Chryseosolibacter indicus TaxID=2782351 RepID=A0ABS5VWB5_9BACT|nr:DUF1343 domain-containing protein [Chryseosolibacter indicus]MBT1705720.1 DUF1343 domain-containing protein [Chryseosolibacter indicus]
MKTIITFSLLLLVFLFFSARLRSNDNLSTSTEIVTGADQVDQYIGYLKGKRVGMVVNQTSIIGNTLSVDSLLSLGINVTTIFGPEHGFRGNASNGAFVQDEIDTKTGKRIISLYGKKRKPSKEDLDLIDVMVFDFQDVGCRFYTNINTLADVMSACAENGKELLILDRPNPNGYVDGPVLDMSLTSAIGKFPIPITHGMTIAEFALMLNGEGWLENKQKCKLKIIKVANYTHDMSYTLPVKPSPNLNTQQAVLLYPSLCLFEGTTLNHGRGTYMPFAVLGSPELKGKYDFSYIPKSIPGMSENPLHQDKACYGIDLRNYDTHTLHKNGKINLQWLFELYNAYPDKQHFFSTVQGTQMGNFHKLAGTTLLKEQIEKGVPEEEIRKSWEPGLSKYKEMRMKYLLYP